MINSSEISFCIQGPIVATTNDAIKKIKELFPESTVIVSTVADINFPVCGADKVIVSEDPGNFKIAQSLPIFNNVNRQIVSTLSGINHVKTRFCFKLRADFFITGRDFLNYVDRFEDCEPEYKVFHNKVLACCYYTRNSHSSSLPFHVSDFAFFGLTEDVRKIFDIPLMPVNEVVWGSSGYNRYYPEQYLFINLLRKNGHIINCDFRDDYTIENATATERYIASNFVLLDYKRFNLMNTKKTFSITNAPLGFASCYTHGEWQQLYRKYLKSDIIIPEIDYDREFITKSVKKFEKKQRYFMFIAKMVSVFIFKKNERRKFRAKVLNFLMNI